MKKFLLAFVIGFALTACTNTTSNSCQCDKCLCDTCLCDVDSISTDTIEVTDTVGIVEVVDSIINE